MNNFSKAFLPVIIFSSIIIWNINSSENIKFRRSTNSVDTLKSDTLSSAQQDSVKTENIAAGNKLYHAKCQKCHTLYNPHDFTLKVWKKNLKEMRWKAELNKEEYNMILLYLTANAGK